MLVVARKNSREPDEWLWRVKRGGEEVVVSPGAGPVVQSWYYYADLLGTMQIRWVDCQVRQSWRREE